MDKKFKPQVYMIIQTSTISMMRDMGKLAYCIFEFKDVGTREIAQGYIDEGDVFTVEHLKSLHNVDHVTTCFL